MPGVYDNETGKFVPLECYDKGQWLEDENGYFYIVPNDRYGLAEILGPGGPLLDKIARACRRNPRGFVPKYMMAKLGLVRVPLSLQRFSAEDGYYHA